MHLVDNQIIDMCQFFLRTLCNVISYRDINFISAGATEGVRVRLRVRAVCPLATPAYGLHQKDKHQQG